MSKRPYWHDGLKFSCQQCGACCCGEPGTIYFSCKELNHLAEYLNEGRDELIRRAFIPYRDGYTARDDLEGGRCIFLGNEGCTIYPLRPAQCRIYPFWRVSLREKSHWEELAQTCPGINCGRYYSAEEISEQASKSPI